MVVALRGLSGPLEKADAGQVWVDGDAPTSEQAPGEAAWPAWSDCVTDYWVSGTYRHAGTGVRWWDDSRPCGRGGPLTEICQFQWVPSPVLRSSCCTP